MLFIPYFRSTRDLINAVSIRHATNISFHRVRTRGSTPPPIIREIARQFFPRFKSSARTRMNFAICSKYSNRHNERRFLDRAKKKKKKKFLPLFEGVRIDSKIDLIRRKEYSVVSLSQTFFKRARREIELG